MSGAGQSVDGNENTQVGGDGVLAEEIEGSNVAGGDISQTNVYHGVEPGEHAKLLSRVAQLESSAGSSVDGGVIEPEEEKGELTPIRETGFYKKSLGKLKEATSFSAISIILSIILLAYAMESPGATDEELSECEEGEIQPADIHSDFEGWTCQEVAEFEAAKRENWGDDDSALLISILLFPMALVTLWRPALNPARILDREIGKLQTPYRTVGLITLFLSFLLALAISFVFPDSTAGDDVMSNLQTASCAASCCFLMIGLNLMFVSAKWDESESVTMEPGDDGDAEVPE